MQRCFQSKYSNISAQVPQRVCTLVLFIRIATKIAGTTALNRERKGSQCIDSDKTVACAQGYVIFILKFLVRLTGVTTEKSFAVHSIKCSRFVCKAEQEIIQC